MLHEVTINALYDELDKIAAKIPYIHGTSRRLRILRPGIGSAILANDPNPRAVYTAMRGRSKQRGIERFAREAAKKRGGEPVVASGKMDTKRGWMPMNLTLWGKKHIGSIDHLRDMVRELDTAEGARRGELWEAINRGAGAWRNDDTSATLKVVKSIAAKT